jgi:hypothetical protein
MKFVSPSWLVLGLSWLAGCGVPQDAPALGAATVETPIIGGSATTGEPAVVALVLGDSARGFDAFCTGTLIAPKTVLTAAHCVGEYSKFSVLFGPSTAKPSRVVRMAAQFRHPDYDGAGERSGYDFGLLRLATPVDDVSPVPLNRAPLTPEWVGQNIRHAGFGVTNARAQSGSNTKLAVDYTVRRFNALELESGANGKQTCNGDSGGPGFMVPPAATQQVLVGVVSWGDRDCNKQGWDGRVDAALEWIEPTMAQWETASCEAGNACVEGCTPVDQDCVCVGDGVCSPECANPLMDPDCSRDCATNGVCAREPCGRPDADCVAVGGACASQYVCHARRCVGDVQHAQPYCTKDCAAAADCPATMECRGGSCAFALRPTRELNQTCSALVEYCSNSTCNGPAQPGAVTRCVLPCKHGRDCPTPGSRCELGVTGERFCFAPTQFFTAVSMPAVGSGQRSGGPVAELEAASCGSVGGLSPLALAALALLPRRLGRRRRGALG